MHQPPEAEEALPELLRQALDRVQRTWRDFLSNGLEDVGQNYGRLVDSVADLTQHVPADMRAEAIQCANGSYRREPVTMNSVVRMHTDYDDIRDALREFFWQFGYFRREFVERGALSTILWASKELNVALDECTSFYHVGFDGSGIDDI